MKIVDGNAIDLFLDDYKNNPYAILLHVVNCRGVMGSGIALEIKKRIPMAYLAYHRAYQNELLTLGSLTFASNVYNMAAQLNYGRYGRHLNYGAFADCLHGVAREIDSLDEVNRGMVNVYVPYKIGCDRAGGDWEVVKEMLDFNFDNLIICKLQK